MTQNKPFNTSNDDEQTHYQREARLQYDPDTVRESQQRWGSYSSAKREIIMEEGNAIYAELWEAYAAGKTTDSADVQALIERWHEHMRHFYEPTLEMLSGLAELYINDARFAENIANGDTEKLEFLKASIHTYVDDLETAELEQMLAEDEERANRLSS